METERGELALRGFDFLLQPLVIQKFYVLLQKLWICANCMRTKSFKEKEERYAEFGIWEPVKQKLKENGKSIEWLSEQVPQGKKTFQWHYSRKCIKTDMVVAISNILNHNFFEDYREYCKAADGMKDKKGSGNCENKRS